MVQWWAVFAPILTGAALWLSYIRYRAYVHEVQRDLFTNLEGREFPQIEPGTGIDDPQFEVVNVDVYTNRLKDWHTLVVLKIDQDEFPWADYDLDDFDFTDDAPEPLNPVARKDVDSINEAMETELMKLGGFMRKSGPTFVPEFTDSTYGPALFLHFPTTNLFEIREQLEMASNTLPLVYASWAQVLAGVDTNFLLSGLRRLSENPELLESIEEELD